jgi:hypothetical protein
LYLFLVEAGGPTALAAAAVAVGPLVLRAAPRLLLLDSGRLLLVRKRAPVVADALALALDFGPDVTVTHRDLAMPVVER